ncbi:MAG: hypothetical protein ABIG11_08745, partial [bacterium]
SIYAANLTAQGVNVLDMTGLPRASFSNNERLMLRQRVNNQAASGNKIVFTFTIYDPGQKAVFQHQGNAAPGTTGQAQTQVAGIPVSQFYSIPGLYKLVARAVLDAETVNQETSFTISSPNIIQTYPPDGARNLSDKPLTFRWTTSGASRYRVTVGNDSSLYNSVFSQENNGGNYLTYPEIVSDPRQNLVAEKVYYWKVEGLDSAGNKVAESAIPYSFSLKPQSASQVRNIAVVSLELNVPKADFSGAIPFKTAVKNLGGGSETNISVRFTLGGMAPADSPKRLETLMPGESRELLFSAFAPADQRQSLAVACIDTFDDNVGDNCKTLLLSREPESKGGGIPSGKTFSYNELMELIRTKLGADFDKALEGYAFDSIACENCQGNELNEIINALISGDSQIVGSNITQLVGSGAETGTAAVGTVEYAGADLAEEPEGPEMPEMDFAGGGEDRQEWSGFTLAFSGKPGTIVVKDNKDWKVMWNKFSTEKTPDVDFKKSMVVGVVAGSAESAAEVRILEAQPEGLGFVVRYYVIEATERQPPGEQAYVLKAVGFSDKEVKFKKLNPEKSGNKR